MKPTVDVSSIESLRSFRAELKRYLESLHGTLESLTMQANRANDWIEQDRSRHWPREAKRASDALVEARNALLRCKMAATEGQQKSCVDEKKAVEHWVKRLRHCESQIRSVRSWRQKMRQQTDEFSTRMSRLSTYAENDLPKAIASLDRMIQALEKYTEIATPSSRSEPSSPSASQDPQNRLENESDAPSAGD